MRTAMMLMEGEQLLIFECLEAVFLCIITRCLCFHIISGTSAAKKHMLKEKSNLNQSSVAQGCAPAVRLLGLQRCRCLSLSQRNHPTLQPQ